MTIKKILNYFLLSILIPLALSCDVISKRKENSTFSTDEWIGKKIQFPKELMLLENTTLVPIDNFEKQHLNSSKIISIVDVTCSSCILGQLNRTDSLFQTLLDQDSDIIFILNVNKADSASFMVSLQPLINVKGYILWDSNFHFETLNDVFLSVLSIEHSYSIPKMR
ncbi:MAG: hypothetical protein HWD62_19010 [Cyclobacteriaceae bacterium]|nr:MAG: hypothetical protein HWD62_19010 [Cyclobacteriaceae bacterium]